MRKYILATISLVSVVSACGSSNSSNGAGAGGAGGFGGDGGAGGTITAVGGTATGGTVTGGTGGFAVGGTGGFAIGGTGGIAVGGTGGVAVGGGGTGGVAQGGTGGTGGTGGQPAVNPCVHTSWVASAMPDHPLMFTPGDVPSNAIDGQAGTRWSTGLTQAGGEWFKVLFPKMVTLGGIVLDTTASATDFPRGYLVEYSTDGTTFMPVMAADGGSLTGVGAVVTTIAFPAPVSLLAVRVTQTGVVVAPATSWWSIHEFTVTNCSAYVAPDAGAPDGGGDGSVSDGSVGDGSVGDAASDASDGG